MDLKDFTEKEQEQIKKGLSTAVLTDKEAAKKILACQKNGLRKFRS